MAKETEVSVEEDGVVNVDLPDGFELGEDELPTLQTIRDAAGGQKTTAAPAAKTGGQVATSRQSAADEATEALAAAKKSAEDERRLRLAAEQTAGAERTRADAATRQAQQASQDTDALREQAEQGKLAGVTSKIDTAKAELASAKQEYERAHDAGEGSKMADAQIRMADAAASIRYSTEKKAELEETAKTRPVRTGHEGRVDAPAPTAGQMFERYVSQFNPKAQAWLRAHPDCAPAQVGGDQSKNDKMMSAHFAAKQHFAEGSDDYYRIIEEQTGYRQPTSAAAQTTAAADGDGAAAAKPQQRRLPAAAPVTRDPPGEGGVPQQARVKLNDQQQEVALFSYPQKQGEDENVWKKRAFGTYATEFIRAKAEGKIGRLTH